MEPLEFITWLLENPRELLLLVVVVCAFFVIVKGVHGKVEIDERGRKLAALIGVVALIFLSVMYLWGHLFPSSVLVSGYVMYPDGRSVFDASIRVPGTTMLVMTDPHGHYTVDGVSRDTEYIEIKVVGKDYCRHYFDPPLKEAKETYKFNVTLPGGNFTLTGYVYDELDVPVEGARVVVADMERVTDVGGFYKIRNVPCDVKDVVKLKVYVDGVLRYRGDVFMSRKGGEVAGSTEFAEKDVYLSSNSTIDVQGVAYYYEKSPLEPKEPVKGMLVEMGGVSTTTGDDGSYLLHDVPRSVRRYNVTSLNGELIISGNLGGTPLHQEPTKYERVYNDCSLRVPIKAKPA